VPLWADIGRSIAEATGAQFHIESRTSVGGGCINAAFRVTGGGRAYFVKTSAPQAADMFAAEAAGLAEIARSQTVRVPQPVCHGSNSEAGWLALEFIAFGSAHRDSSRALGQSLAAMHRVTAPRFGWQRDNAIGATPQPNTLCADWAGFWRERRLGFQLALAARNGAPGSLLAKGGRLLRDFPALLAGCAVAPALLHGDLWGGNAGVDSAGLPVIYDPAVYYGHREADLAMTELFGGFDADFHAAYREAFPLDAGYPVRKQLYNLYHVLNHYNLFGGGYARQAEAMVDRLLAEI
jgi:fructosamine-3-kinase